MFQASFLSLSTLQVLCGCSRSQSLWQVSGLGLWLIRLDLDSMWGQGWAANPKCGGRDINGVRVGGCGGHKPCFPTTG